MDQQKVHACVEALCQSGCAMVRATISAMEHELPIAQAHGLARDEATAVLTELKAIMAVYDRRAS